MSLSQLQAVSDHHPAVGSPHKPVFKAPWWGILQAKLFLQHLAHTKHPRSAFKNTEILPCRAAALFIQSRNTTQMKHFLTHTLSFDGIQSPLGGKILLNGKRGGILPHVGRDPNKCILTTSMYSASPVQNVPICDPALLGLQCAQAATSSCCIWTQREPINRSSRADIH